MDPIIDDPEAARRLARTIVSDIAAYNQAGIERAVADDTLFSALAPQIEEGRAHYEDRVLAELVGQGHFEKALVDFLLKPFGYVRSPLW